MGALSKLALVTLMLAIPTAAECEWCGKDKTVVAQKTIDGDEYDMCNDCFSTSDGGAVDTYLSGRRLGFQVRKGDPPVLVKLLKEISAAHRKWQRSQSRR